MPREFFSVAPVSSVDLNALNQLVADLNVRLTDITLAITRLEVTSDAQARLIRDLDRRVRKLTP